MSDTSKFGLSRTIPTKIKQSVRKRVGFGCVKCGLGFYQYEHFDPDFANAKEHNAEGITLLCPTCHSLKTTNKINSKRIEKWNKKPKCLEQGFSRFKIPSVSESEDVSIQIGNSIFHSPESILMIDGEPIVKLQKSQDEEEPILLTFISSEKPNSNRIVENEWLTDNDSWDITCEGNKVTVRAETKKLISFEYNLGNIFKFHDLNINYKSIRIETLKIRAKRFGNIICKKQTIFRVINSKGVEISRFSSINQKRNEITWKNALDIQNDYMNPTLSGLTLNNGDFYYVHNSDSPTMTKCNISSSVVNIGLAQEIREFIGFINSMSHKDQREFKFRRSYLKHIKLLDQLPLEEKQKILAL